MSEKRNRFCVLQDISVICDGNCDECGIWDQEDLI